MPLRYGFYASSVAWRQVNRLGVEETVRCLVIVVRLVGLGGAKRRDSRIQ